MTGWRLGYGIMPAALAEVRRRSAKRRNPLPQLAWFEALRVGIDGQQQDHRPDVQREPLREESRFLISRVTEKLEEQRGADGEGGAQGHGLGHKVGEHGDQLRGLCPRAGQPHVQSHEERGRMVLSSNFQRILRKRILMVP